MVVKRRHLAVACMALLASGADARVTRASLSVRFAQWRRKLLRSHLGLLLLGAVAIGVPIAVRARFTRPKEPPPWERDAAPRRDAGSA
jgi:hypothetical protein